jgi:class 3 adenylate cyclase
MSLDLQKILESKRALRRILAARPVAEKLRMLDALRERELAIRGRAGPLETSTLRENPAPYGGKA